MKSMPVKFLLTALMLSMTMPSTALASKAMYLQLGSFSNKSNAYHLKKLTQTKTHYPVSVRYIQHYYVVKVGPMHSASQVNGVKQALGLAKPQKKIAVATEEQVIIRKVNYKPHSQIINEDTAQAERTPFVAGYVGVEKPNINSHMTVNNGSGYAPPYDLDNYSTNENTAASAALEAGYRWKHNKSWIPVYAVSVRYQHLFSNDIGDKVMQYSLPEFTNYTYQWNVVSDIFVLLGKLDLAEWHHFMPYVTGGAGVSFNRVTNYKESAIPPVTPRTSPGFNDNTVNRFTYQVGAGVDWQVTPKVIASLDYAYQDLGKIISGPGAGSWSSSSLSTSRYHINTVMLGVNYLF